MAIISPAIGVQSGSHSALAFRQLAAASLGIVVETFVNSVTAVTPGHGLSRLGDLAVTQNGTPNMSVNVAKGSALITGNSVLAQGVYAVTNDATVNLAIATADATNPRRDLVVVQVRDNTTDASGFNDARLFVVTGTPAASPVDPAIPAGCLVLARVAVAALATSIVNANITMLAQVRLVAGGQRMACYLEHNVAQPVPNLTVTALTFNTEVYDVGDLHAPGDPTKITIPTGGDGLWLIQGWSSFFAVTGGTYRQQWFKKNGGATPILALSTFYPSATVTGANHGSLCLRLVAGDYLQMVVAQDTGAGQNVQGTNSAGGLIGFQATRMGD